MAENIETLPKIVETDDAAFITNDVLIPVSLKISTSLRKTVAITVTQLKTLFSGDLNAKEDTANKTGNIVDFLTSTAKFWHVKGVVDYVASELGSKQDNLTSSAAFINGLTGKTTPVDADVILIGDSAATWFSKKVSFADLKTFLKTYFDTLYAPKTLLHTYNRQTASYTAVLTDVTNAANNNVIVMITSSSANTFTIPPNASVAFPLGCRIDFKQGGAGQTTMTAGAGVTLQAPHGLKVQAQYGAVSLVQDDVTPDLWWVIGDLTT